MKTVIRKNILGKRDALSSSLIKGKSAEIFKTVRALSELKRAETVLVYLSFGSEVFTHNFIKSTIKIKRIVVPVVTNKKKKQVMLSYLYDWECLSPAAYGILEPKKGFIHPASNMDIDLALVPGIAFDLQGHRIGYGCGYFDRILIELIVFKVGLAFDFQSVDTVPYTNLDVSMDIIVTENRVISCLH